MESSLQQCIYVGAGLKLNICGEPSTALDVMIRLFALAKIGHCDNAMPLRVWRYEVDQLADKLPGWLSEAILTSEDDFDLRFIHGPQNSCAAALRIEQNLTCAWFDSESQEISLAIASSNMERTACSIQTVISPVLRDVLLNRGGLLLHSASLMRSDGQGILLLGDGGGGKTTSALAGVFAGAKIMGDDLAVLSFTDSGIKLEGIAELLNLSKQTMGFFEELSELYDKFDQMHNGEDRGKVPILPVEVPGLEFYRGSCPLDAIYQVHISEDGPAATPKAPGEALGMLMKSATFSPDHSPTKAMAEMLFQLSMGKVYDLYTGPSPRELGRWLESHCGQ